MTILRNLIDVVLPSRCPFTGDLVDRPGMISAEAWAKLTFIGAPVCDTCGFPFEFAVGKDALCASCLAGPPVFVKARAALAYDDHSRDFILGFKHGDQTASIDAMIPWLRNAGSDLWSETDVIVPVPLHRGRLLRRRYNQSALIGRAMARAIGLPFFPDALVRTRATPTQGHLTVLQRHENVKNAFHIDRGQADRVHKKTVMLIDDVYTTGATVGECAKTLLDGGARQVFILTLARVVRPQRG